MKKQSNGNHLKQKTEQKAQKEKSHVDVAGRDFTVAACWLEAVTLAPSYLKVPLAKINKET
jgi:hypothetical protein